VRVATVQPEGREDALEIGGGEVEGLQARPSV
jgi:hypothetical protein